MVKKNKGNYLAEVVGEDEKGNQLVELHKLILKGNNFKIEKMDEEKMDEEKMDIDSAKKNYSIIGLIGNN